MKANGVLAAFNCMYYFLQPRRLYVVEVSRYILYLLYEIIVLYRMCVLVLESSTLKAGLLLASPAHLAVAVMQNWQVNT